MAVLFEEAFRFAGRFFLRPDGLGTCAGLDKPPVFYYCSCQELCPGAVYAVMNVTTEHSCGLFCPADELPEVQVERSGLSGKCLLNLLLR